MALKIAKRGLEFLENCPADIKGWIIAFFSIVAVRILVEVLISQFDVNSSESLIGSIIHTIFFFLMSSVLLVLFLQILLKEQFSKVFIIVLWGLWIIITPPIIDKLVFGEQQVFSFYLFDSISGLIFRFFHFFGNNPHFGITIGTRVEVFLVSFGLGAYIYLKKSRVVFAVIGALGAYLILFVLGALPSLLGWVINAALQIDQKTTSTTIAKIFLSPLRYFNFETKDSFSYLHYKMSLIYSLITFGLLGLVQYRVSKEKFFSLLRNVRYPQTVFNSGIFFMGLGLGWYYFPHNFSFDVFSLLVVANLILAIFCAWYFSVFINDFQDVSIDSLTNQDRPLIKNIFSKEEFSQYAVVFLIYSLLLAVLVHPKFFLLILAYHFLTYVYSSPPFRLKRFLGIASLLSSFASLIFFFMGYSLVSEKGVLTHLPWGAVALLFFAYAFIIPLKDLKDTEGDKKDGVWTLPVLVGQQRARRILSVLIIFCYFLSTVVLHERGLALPSLVFGLFSYWLINNEKIHPRKLIWIILLVAFFYGLVLVEITFR